MAILTLGFSMGTVAGPALGGLLAEPCDVFGDGFPFCKPGELFFERCLLWTGFGMHAVMQCIGSMVDSF